MGNGKRMTNNRLTTIGSIYFHFFLCMCLTINNGRGRRESGVLLFEECKSGHGKNGKGIAINRLITIGRVYFPFFLYMCLTPNNIRVAWQSSFLGYLKMINLLYRLVTTKACAVLVYPLNLAVTFGSAENVVLRDSQKMIVG